MKCDMLILLQELQYW